jgi:tRNA-(ms[2]io[6]A)-hydroxylase
MKVMEKGHSRERTLLEKLLLCALIEARSCERFRLLSLYCSDEGLRVFYHKFMVAEAGHYVLFIELARKYFDREVVDKRWEEFLAFEANLLANIEVRGDRMH